MGSRKAIAALTRLLNQIPELRKIEYGNEEYDSWHYEVRDKLENYFGRNSVEYRRFTERWRSWDRNASKKEKQEEYLKKLNKDETILVSIIRRLEDRPKYYFLKVVFSKRIYLELKDFIATIIAKYMKEKTN
jgi:hypothetical protein